jgi:hypothetical protein
MLSSATLAFVPEGRRPFGAARVRASLWIGLNGANSRVA